MESNRITLRAVVLGALFSGLFAWYTVVAENLAANAHILTATQIPVLPFLFLIAGALILNPLCRALRVVRPLATAELMTVFVMTMVSSGISTFGLTSQLIPTVAGLFNRNWNTAQARWDRHIEPFINEAYFISEPGIREHAAATRGAENAWRAADSALRAARGLDIARKAVRDLEQAVSATAEDATGARGRKLRQLAIERDRLAAAESRWAKAGAGEDWSTVLDTYPARVAGLRAAYDLCRSAQAALETRAFDRVEEFRRGLPKPLRAVPGLLPAETESMSVYASRLRRMGAGLRAAGDLAAAGRELAGGDGAPARDAGRERLRQAIARLETVDETAAMTARRAELTGRRAELDALLAEAQRSVDDLQAQRRSAGADRFDALDRGIRDARDSVTRLNADRRAVDAEIASVVDPRLQLSAEIADVTAGLRDLEARWARGDAAEGLGASLDTAAAAIEGLSISWRSLLAGDVPWRQWGGPLLRWGVLIAAVYVMLMSFNGLIFRQWAHHEKLSYPLAELPLTLSGDDDGSGRVPSLYRSGLFWAGVATSACTLGWNLLATRQIISGIAPIPLRFSWGPYVADSVLSGLTTGGHEIFFTLIGISFLVPARISKSLWGFHVGYMLLLLVLCWLGYGGNEKWFPMNMTMVLNFRTAVGGGALTAFSAMTLWTCRRYLLCAATPGVLEGLDPSERTELRVSSALFWISSAVLVGMLSFGMGANLVFAILCYLTVITLTIGFIRVVAEGGLPVIKSYFGPFHIIRSTVGMNRPWSSVPLFAPLIVFQYVMLWDLKTFIAPAMANAYKIRDHLGLQRLRFHAAVWLGIAVAVTVAVTTHLIFAYQRGGNAMRRWFYTAGPRGLYNGIVEMATTNPIDQAGGLYWMLAGVAVMTALLVWRRHRSSLPHPIGLVMWVNPQMWSMWFSIFLGWAFKTLVGRYGDRTTYLRLRMYFIGLIVGELFMCLFGVELNR